MTADERAKAVAFDITSGNWKHDPNISIFEQIQQQIRDNPSYEAIMLSSESLFWQITTLLKEKGQWENKFNIHIILAVRELEEMLSSEYQQRVKRHGENRPFEQFLRSHHFVSSHHKRAATVLDLIQKLNIKATVLNYSKNKFQISKLIFDTINSVEIYPAKAMEGLIINRSLSQKELQFLTMINALYHEKHPWISARLSDALAKQLPHVQSQPCRISANSRRKLYELNEPYITTINNHLPDRENLTQGKDLASFAEPDRPPEYYQAIKRDEERSIQLISETLYNALRGNDTNNQPSNQAIDQLIKLSQNQEVSNNVRIQMLEIAKIFRPNGERLSKLLKKALDSRKK